MIIKKYLARFLKILRQNRLFILSFGIIFLFAFWLRTKDLTSFPIFADEAIYIRWSQVMRAEPTLRFLPLSDGKQPFFMWLTIPFLKIFADPVFAGRFVSVLSGLSSLVGLAFLGWLLFRSLKISLILAALYAILPYAVFFNRMALVDSLLFAFSVWILVVALLLAKTARNDLAFILGGLLGGALITKSPGLFFAGLLPLMILLNLPQKFASLEKKQIHFLKLFFQILLIYFLAVLIYNLLRLGPGFEMIGLRNKDYVFSFGEILKHPLNPLRHHLKDAWAWYGNLFTWPLWLLVIFGGLSLAVSKPILFLSLLAWAILPLLAQSAIAKVFTPRYLFFTITPFLIFLAFLLGKFNLRRHWPILALLSFLPLRYDWLILKNPPQAPLPAKMRTGYLEEWSSGYGLTEVRDYLNNLLVQGEKKVIVATEGYFGTLPDGLFIHFDKERRVEIIGVGQPIEDVPEFLKENSLQYPCFLVVNKSRLNTDDPSLHLVFEVPKAVSEKNADYLQFFQIK